MYKPKSLILTLLLIVSLTLTAQTTDLRQNKISITAAETPVTRLLTTLATMAGCNIIVSSDGAAGAETLVTLTMNDVSFETALSTIVLSAGLSYRYVGENTFVVGLKENIQSEVGQRSYIIQLNYLEAEKIARAFEAFGGNVIAIEGQNALMVYANPETYADIKARIDELDTPQLQIEIRARLIEVNINDTKKMGIDWSKLSSLTTILAENPVNADGAGLPYGYFDDTGRTPHGNLYDLYRLPEQQYFQKIDGFNDVGHFSRQLTAFEIQINWLLENNAAKLLTDTRLVARNGGEAEILVGEVVPFVVMDNDRQVQVEREETGIMLSIKPTVNKDRQITVTIAPEVSSVTDLVGGYVPRTRTRRASTTVTVPDGQKIHIGGLLSSNSVNTVYKLPLLGSIPLIGRLFQYHYTSIQNTDLVIEITPRIINIAEEQYDYEVDERMTQPLIRRITDEDTEEGGEK